MENKMKCCLWHQCSGFQPTWVERKQRYCYHNTLCGDRKK